MDRTTEIVPRAAICRCGACRENDYVHTVECVINKDYELPPLSPLRTFLRDLERGAIVPSSKNSTRG